VTTGRKHSAVCPACFEPLPTRFDEGELKCPRCGHLLAPRDDLPKTVAHTPIAKRSPGRPGDDK